MVDHKVLINVLASAGLVWPPLLSSNQWVFFWFSAVFLYLNSITNDCSGGGDANAKFYTISYTFFQVT